MHLSQIEISVYNEGMILNPDTIKFNNNALEYILSFYSSRTQQEMFNLLEKSYPNELVGFRLKKIDDGFYEIGEYISKANTLADFSTFDFLRMVVEERNGIQIDTIYFYEYGFEGRIPICPVPIELSQILETPFNKNAYYHFLKNWMRFDTDKGLALDYSSKVLFQYRFQSDLGENLDNRISAYFESKWKGKYKLSKKENNYVFLCHLNLEFDHPVFQFMSLAEELNGIKFKDIIVMQNGIKHSFTEKKQFPYFTKNIDEVLDFFIGY